MIRAALISSASLLWVTAAFAQAEGPNASVDIAPPPAAKPVAPDAPAAASTKPATDTPAAAAAKPATTTPKLRTSTAKTASTADNTPPPAPVSNYVPETPAGEPKVTDAVAAKDGIKRLLVLRGLDKITGRPTNIYAPVGVPVKFATLEITARYCYSTPTSEPPETTAFLQIDDHRIDKPAKREFSGWMLASSPSLNALEHPLYDVWVISCMTNRPGQTAPVVASTAAVKTVSPEVGAKEAMPDLPEGSGQ
jgi:hypothetical protein